jgi:uncharacterized cupredoxin-like copper-binding protein
VKSRSIGFVLIAVGLIGLLGTGVLAAGGHVPGGSRWAQWGAVSGAAACTPPAFEGQTVDVIVSDMGAGMMGGRMMNISASPSTVSAGGVSFLVWNQGMMVHEFIVLPLSTGEVGGRAIGADGRVDESGSLGEASSACGNGAGDGIPPGSASWVTLHLDPGRYELICNLPGHYARGMFTELDVS